MISVNKRGQKMFYCWLLARIVDVQLMWEEFTLHYVDTKSRQTGLIVFTASSALFMLQLFPNTSRQISLRFVWDGLRGAPKKES